MRQKTECPYCNRMISNSNIKAHKKACNNPNKKVHRKITDDMFIDGYYICPKCEFKSTTKSGIGSHIWRKHENGIGFVSITKGTHVAWNKGLSKETDSRVMQNALSVKKFYTENTPYWKNHKHTLETKKKLSKIMSVKNKGGRCKWYEVSGQKVQGTWERNIALKMEELEISWKKIGTNNYTFSYIKDECEHSYTPDFHLVDYDFYLEIKGYWWGDDENKMKLVFEQNPESINKVKIIKEDIYKKLLKCDSKETFLSLVNICRNVMA